MLELTVPAVGNVTFSLDAATSSLGASIDPSSGVFSWTPNEEQGPGEYELTVTIADQQNSALTDTKSFNVTVLEVNSAPVLALPPGVAGQITQIEDGEELSFFATATQYARSSNESRNSFRSNTHRPNIPIETLSPDQEF